MFQSKINATIDIKKSYLENPNWVAITGSSDGIGKGLAMELAKYDFNTLLIARN